LGFTPVRSPESNGIAEAFVKTFKRDYARLSILPDAETVIALLPAWFEETGELKVIGAPADFERNAITTPSGVRPGRRPVCRF
jgi:hypothetical protein